MRGALTEDGLKPLLLAAEREERQIIKLLVKAGADPNVMNIMIIHKKKEIFPDSKSRGTSAFRRKEYRLAVYWYTQALEVRPSDAPALSNRSLCYVYLNKRDDALKDAERCVLAKAGWPKAPYRKGVALKLLNGGFFNQGEVCHC
ncbi:heat shock protein sti1 homolog isoform X2 [Papaver somniferum]|uniref:heat shock protein sti1 homolog isoform X2 n=1 Tax=Papaver somniferum TaxID=3469 RepID=UPI000E70182B|nr:heat shock protein sti1 homolog isoform X2 [Papaver somniferum]